MIVLSLLFLALYLSQPRDSTSMFNKALASGATMRVTAMEIAHIGNYYNNETVRKHEYTK